MPAAREIPSLPRVDLLALLNQQGPVIVADSEEGRRGKRDKLVFTATPSLPTVRGKIISTPAAAKSESFNKPWSDEEQLRFEKLLVEFPEEAVASHRWNKIAQALGNRTGKQVASRAQKHFIKLSKAGLPVPGKISNDYAERRAKRKHQEVREPISLESGSENDDNSDTNDEDNNDSDDDLSNIDPALRESAEYQELLQLQKLAKRQH
eukprot:TRINITY_DN2540_c0_g1_i3.p2 TRINITY_DN2540_c0_g1~~TRINITY_DN2540_c0_g1_i3.p2  ORF type:complete len:208 (+),score=40.20 TRINITY_DN2540_c0_g1_i3:248-871(+)